MRVRTLLAFVLVCGLASCGPKTADQTAAGTPPVNAADTLNGAQPLPPSGGQPPATQVNPPPPVNNTPRTPPVSSRPPRSGGRQDAREDALDIGTVIPTTMIDSVHSRYTKIGDRIMVRVNNDVRGRDGRTVIPAGSVVTLNVTDIGMADSRGEKGTLELAARSIDVHGSTRPLNARATDYEYEMRTRGISNGDVEKTGAGAVAGAILGRVIGGKKGTVVGAVGGGMVGAAVASQTADRDIIVHAGTNVTLTLGERFGGN